MKEISEIEKQFKEAFKKVNTLDDLEQMRVQYLGKKGPVQGLMKLLGSLSKEDRPKAGKDINELKQKITKSLEEGRAKLQEKAFEASYEEEKIDVTLPGAPSFSKGMHVVQHFLEEVLNLFKGMGFSVQYGPHTENEYYNFDALNFPEDHPAKDMHDTFYLSPEILLRTHTSNSQIRTMKEHTPPIRMVSPGRCFRNEDIDASHHIMFHQVEGLYVDEGVSFVDLISTLEDFVKKLLGENTKIRFRPSYFPFVEPGLELDVLWCKGGEEKWLEILGAGMVHPNVLKNVGVDPEKYTGYAFGMGIERLVMLTYGIDDIRYLTENDLRFLKQFS